MYSCVPREGSNKQGGGTKEKKVIYIITFHLSLTIPSLSLVERERPL